MCGIAGFAGQGDRDILVRMTTRLAHRGPDAEGFYVDDDRRVFLGHRRLSVLDIAGGVQPMANEDGDVVVVFNGEIYNHRQLRAELEAKGHRFRTDHSDTEVLVEGWRAWGPELPRRLNGMFAFAVLDRRRNILFLARDRFGEKPLYYCHRDGLFAFASELTAILDHPAVPAEVDPVSVQKFFAHCFFPAPNTLYKAVRKLPAGTQMTVALDGLSVRQERYWQFHIEPAPAPRPGDMERWAEELRFLFGQAVTRRLESDVRLGIFLSGGVDSSAVLHAAAQRVPPSDIDTFSIGFNEPSYDESVFAREMAEHMGVRHHVEMCDLSLAKSEVPGLMERLDEPMADSSILPTWMLCRFARKSVTVALSGDGGDELFAGYDTFKALGIAKRMHGLLPKAVRRALPGLAAWLPRSDRNMSLDFKIRRGLRGIQHGPELWNPAWIGAMGPEEIVDHFTHPLELDELYSEARALWLDSAADNNVDRSLEFYSNLYLPDDILTKSDRASMLVSLEVRAPFLDNDLVEFTRRLPWQAKLAGGERKHILKMALRGHLPDAVLDRRKKGFGIPLQAWLRDFQPPSRPVPHLDKAALARRWHEHAQVERDNRHMLWCWMALERHLHRPT